MSKEDLLAQDRTSLQDLYLVMVQTIEVLEPYAARYSEIAKHLAEARSICNDLQIKLQNLGQDIGDPAARQKINS